MIFSDWSLKNVLIVAACCGAAVIALRFGLFRGQKPISAAGKSPEIQEEISSYIQKHAVMVFSKSYCPYCTRAKDALRKMNVDFGVLELDTIPNGTVIQEGLLLLTKQRTVPNIFVNQIHLGGCDSLMAAIKNGQFQTMLDTKKSN